MSSFVWSVVFFTLIGLAVGAGAGYQMAHTMVNRTHTKVATAVVVLMIPFTIYLSLDKIPLLTQLAYALPAFGISFIWVSSLVIQNAQSKEDEEHDVFLRKTRRKKEAIKEEMSLEDLLAEKARRDAARKFEDHITDLSDAELDEKIKHLRRKN